MADPRKRLEGNVPGGFYVDSTCIDCDLCRQIAPGIFRSQGESSVVHRQPESPREFRRAEMALVSCPTASIGTLEKRDLSGAIGAFPELIEEDVYFCGFASPASYGGSSYLIVRPRGNVLIDSPRFSMPLVRNIEALGGVKLMFLTHRDDVADHDTFHRHFGCERIMHGEDATFPVERRIEGYAPVRIGDDLVVLPTPGHTAGHQSLLYRDKFLFTGDHVWWDPEDRRLSASRRYCWYSWNEQRRSMKRLLDWRFEWILPGHGARHHLAPADFRRELKQLISRM